MRNRTACFTGHRNTPQDKHLTESLQTTILQLINEGYCYFGVGGALGFDTMAAQTVLSLKSKYPHIKLILVLPCPNQTDGWNYKDKNKYDNIKEAADKVVYTSQAYYPG